MNEFISGYKAEFVRFRVLLRIALTAASYYKKDLRLLQLLRPKDKVSRVFRGSGSTSGQAVGISFPITSRDGLHQHLTHLSDLR
jgi:hypothetical protein